MLSTRCRPAEEKVYYVFIVADSIHSFFLLCLLSFFLPSFTTRRDTFSELRDTRHSMGSWVTSTNLASHPSSPGIPPLRPTRSDFGDRYKSTSLQHHHDSSRHHRHHSPRSHHACLQSSTRELQNVAAPLDGASVIAGISILNS